MDIFLGHVTSESLEDGFQGVFGRGDGVGDRDGLEADAEVVGEDAGVVARVLRGNGGGERNTDDVLRAESFCGDHGDERRVDAATERDERFFETGFLRVIPQPQDEGCVNISEFGLLKAGRGYGTNVGVNDADFFCERGQARSDTTVGLSHETTTVEDEFVVAADGVHVGDGATEGAG